MKTIHIVIISVLALAAIVLAVMYTSSSEKPNCAQNPTAAGCTTGSVVSDNCGGVGQPSCSEYCAQHPTDPDCRETIG